MYIKAAHRTLMKLFPGHFLYRGAKKKEKLKMNKVKQGKNLVAVNHNL
jgi:hypothetical protein